MSTAGAENRTHMGEQTNKQMRDTRKVPMTKKLLAGFSSFALLLGIGILGSTSGAVVPEAQAIPVAGAQPVSRSDGTPTWTTLDNYQAVWLQSLTDDAVYWATVASTPPTTVGNQSNILWQAYDWSDDMTTYKTRPVMAFQLMSSGGQRVTYQNFRTQAIARIGGTMTNPAAPLSIYLWDNNAPTSNGGLSCSAGHTPMVRVTSGDPKVEYACAPIPDAYVTTNSSCAYPTGFCPRLGNGESYGGEADQLTGNLYILSGPGGRIDNRNITGTYATAASTQTAWTFLVWNPVTGAYSMSGSPQPGDWYQGMTTVPTERIKVRAGSANEDDNYTPRSSSDFALDADGNIYTYSGRTVSTTNERNMSIVRLEPARDAQGNIVDGTPSNPWRYFVSAKIRKDTTQANIGWQAANSIYGEAFLNGQLLLGASTGITGGSALNRPATATAGYDGTTTMIKIDPLTSTARAVWSIQNDDMPSPAGARADDDASAQQAQVISGYVYNDANGDGMISDLEMYKDTDGNGAISEDENEQNGIPDQNVALYDSSYKLISVQQTDSSGQYDFIVSGSGERTYYVRPVQIQIPLTDSGPVINAVQTWGAGSVGIGYNSTGGELVNTVAIQCAGADAITSADGGACQGAKATDSIEAPLTQDTSADGFYVLGDTSSPDQWMSYAKVTLNTDQSKPTADFGFTIAGSYGDSPAGPTTDSVPVHINGVSSVWLGQNPGVYAGPATDNSHTTDDGVAISTYAGTIPLQGTLVAANTPYTLVGTLSGNQAANASVKGWTGAGTSWNTSAAWTPTVSNGTATGTVTFAASGSGASTVLFRAEASTASITSPTNTNNEYYSDLTGAPSWMTPGEIEDYSLTVGDSIYRPAVTTTTGSGTFVVDGQSLTADNTKYTIGTATSTTAGSKTITATAPDTSWILSSAKVKNITSGAEVGSASFTTSGTTTTITWSPALGDDSIIDLVYTKAPDPVKSTLVLDKDTASVGSFITGTVTVRDADGQALADQPVTFAKASSDTTISKTSCTTDENGECIVTITSSNAKTYTDELTATVSVGGAQVPVSGSPATVTFKADKGDPNQSSLAITPSSPQPVGTSYTGTATVKDGSGNPVEGQVVTFTVTTTIPGAPSDMSDVCTTDELGKCSIQATSPVPGTFVVHATIPSLTDGTPTDIQNSPQTVVFTAGPVCVVEAGCTPDPGVTNITHVAVTTDRMANDGVTPDIITAYAYDKGGFPVSTTVTISTTDSDLTLLGDRIVTNETTGEGTLGATSTVASLHQAHAFIDGTELTAHGSPLGLTFITGAAVPSKSTLALDRTSQTVDSPVVATVTARDNTESLVEGATVTFSVSGSAVIDGQSSCVTRADGTCSVTFTDSATEQVSVHGMLGTTDVSNSPLTVTFTSDVVCIYPQCTPDPGVDDNHRTRVEVTSDNEAVNTGTDVATVYAFDQHGNAVSNAVVASSTDDLALTIGTGIARTSSLGVSTVLYQSSAQGGHDATVTINGTEVKFLPQGKTEVDPTKSSPITLTFSAGRACVYPQCTPDPDVDDSHRTRVEVTTNDQSVDGGTDVATVYAFDQQGNAVAGATVASTTTDSALHISGPVAPTNSNGTSLISYTSTAVGGHNATVTIDGAEVKFLPQGKTEIDDSKSSPITLNFVTGGVCIAPACIPDPGVDNAHRTRVEVTKDLQSVDGGIDQATVYAFDKTGSPVSGATVTSTTTDSKLVIGTGIAATNAQGTSVISYTSDVAGGHDAAVMINGTPVAYWPQNATAIDQSKSSPIRLQFVAGPVCVYPDCTPGPDVDNAHRTRVEVTKDLQSVDGGVDQATVYAFDAKGNAVSGATVASTTDDPALTVGTGIAKTNSQGESIVSYTATAIGSHDAVVTINGTEVKYVPQGATAPSAAMSSPISLRFISGGVCVYPQCTPDPNVDNDHRTRVEVTKDNQSVDGGVDQATVYAFDRLGNPVTGSVVTSTTTDAALTIGTGIPVTNAQGQSLISYTSTVTGGHDAVVKLDGTEVKYVPQGATEPEDSKSSPITLTFGAGGVCIAPACTPDPSVDNDHRTRVEVDPNDQPVDGSPDVATVYAFDRLGNAVVGATVTSTTSDEALSIATIARTNGSGQSKVSYTSTVAGSHQAAVMINGTEVKYLPQGQTATDPSKSSPIELRFVAGGVCVYPACTPDPDVDNAHRTRVEVAPNDQPVGGTDVATVYAFDAHGNAISGASVASTTTDAALSIGTGIAATNAQGTSTIRYTSIVSGSHSAAVTIDGVEVKYLPQGATAPDASKSSPIALRFVAGGVCIAPDCTPDENVDNAHRTRVEVAPDNQPVVTGTDVATVYAFDQHGNAVIGASVASTTTDPALVIGENIATTNTAGTSTVSYTSMVSGGHVAVVTINGTAVKYLPQGATAPDASKSSPITVHFASGSVCIAPDCTPDENVDNAHRTRVEVTTDNQIAGTGTDVATVYAFDQHGNPVIGAGVTSTTTDKALVIGDSIAATNDNGTSTVSYTSTVAGAHVAVVMINNTEVKFLPQGATEINASKSSPITLNFVAGGVCIAPDCTPDESVDNAHRTRVEVTTDNALVGSGADVATVYAFDKYGNPVADAVVASSTTDSGLVISSAIAATNDKGTSTISYTSAVAGAHVATVTIDGKAVAYLPQGATQVDPSKSSPITLHFTALAVKTGGAAVTNSGWLYAMLSMMVAGTGIAAFGLRRKMAGNR